MTANTKKRFWNPAASIRRSTWMCVARVRRIFLSSKAAPWEKAFTGSPKGRSTKWRPTWPRPITMPRPSANRLPEEDSHLERARTGDADAYRYIVEGYQDRVYRLVLSMIGRP